MPASTTGPATTRADAVSRFFTDLAQPGHLATFESEHATLRFDVLGADSRPERWYVTIRDGDVSVTRQAGRADAVITVRRPVAAALLTGRINAFAALLRGLLTCEGSAAACITFQRCLPGPPGSVGRVAPISSGAVMAQHAAPRGRPRGVAPPGQQSGGIRGVAPPGQQSGGIRGVAPPGQPQQRRRRK